MKLSRKWLQYTGAVLLAGACGAVMIMAAGFLYLAPQLPPAAELRQVEFQIPLRIYSREGHLIGEFGEQHRTPVSLEDIPEPFIQAVLSAEDERFFRHGGVDVRGLARASLELLRYREIRSGGSTITMQVARNFFLTRDQTFLRKFNEIVLALQIEQLLTKEEILELYLNKIFLGYRAYGAEAAAQAYYGESITELDLARWAMIAGLPRAPSAYNPIRNPERAVARRNWILGRMLRLGHISQDEHDEAIGAPVTARFHGTRPEVEASYLAEMARREVVDSYGEEAYTQGIRVYTTIDADMQRASVRALRQGLHAYDERHGWRGAESRIEVEDLPELPDRQDTGDDVDREIVDAWTAGLREFFSVGELEPALVVEAGDEKARLLLRDGEQVTLPMAAMEWARPYLDPHTVGRAPEKPSDILSAGDVVRLRPHGGDTGWRLAQVPTVQGALTAVDPQNGAVRAMQGGYSFRLSQFNRASDSRRQTGSAFKPFVFAAGLENGMTPATVLNDAPIVFEDDQLEAAWRPTGASDRFYGPTRLREALYRSLNLVSIRLLRQVGIRNTLNLLEELEFPVNNFARDLSLALGSAAMTPLEMASGYALFANGGYITTPWIIERIEDRHGEQLWQVPSIVLCNQHCQQAREEQRENAAELLPEDGQVIWQPRRLDERTAWLMDSMLQDVIRRGTGRAATRLGRNDLAGKTGSTNEFMDAWFAGYSPSLVAVSWVGFDSPATLGRGEFGGRAALPIWIDFMEQALRGVPEISIPQPPGIVSARINPESGLRARPGDPDAVFEYFRDGRVPDEDDSRPRRRDDGNGDTVSPEDLF